MIVFVSASAFFPMENLFITFSSPEAAYRYYTGRNEDIELVVEGVTCDFVVSKNDSSTYLILPRTTSGWKIGIGSNTRKIIQQLYDEYTIYVYQYKNTEEYFIAITAINGEPLEITDSYGSTFATLTETGNSLNIPITSYFTSISNLNQHYRLIINNESIMLK